LSGEWGFRGGHACVSRLIVRLGLSLRLGLNPILRRAIGGDLVQILGVFQLHEIRDIKESVPLQANIDKGRLHTRKDAGYASFIDGTCQGVFIFALEVDFREQIVFDQPHFGFVGCGRHKQFFCHANSGLGPSGGHEITGSKAEEDREDQALR
jgi:hypothetical protein